MEVRYEQVSKLFGMTPALSRLDLNVPDGAFLALLGPSGCGKTTALRILSGLERPTSGRVYIGPRQVTWLEPKDRDVAMVFQSYALYPHMTVEQNIAYPLRIRGVDAAKRAQQVGEVAALLRIPELLKRRPRNLSGGQRQRVALARAIVRRPSVFLMDEPLSNLDAELRLHMRGELKHLQKSLATTTIYVTHDQAEALTMADVIAVMDKGVLQQVGSPRQIYDSPANRFVAKFVGSPGMNLIRGSFDVESETFQGPRFRLSLATPILRALAEMADGQAVDLGVRPEDIKLSAHSNDTSFPAEVYAVEPMGHETLIELRLDRVPLLVRAAAEFDLSMGETVWLELDPQRLYVFDAESGACLNRRSATTNSPQSAQPQKCA